MTIIKVRAKQEQWKALKRKAFDFGNKFDIGVSIDNEVSKDGTIEIEVYWGTQEQIETMKRSFAKWEMKNANK